MEQVASQEVAICVAVFNYLRKFFDPWKIGFVSSGIYVPTYKAPINLFVDLLHIIHNIVKLIQI